MAPKTDFHRFCIDFAMILEWISQVYFDRYCDEVESEFGFVLPRGRKDAKLRSSEGMQARSRARNGIRSHIRGSCSKSLCSLTLHSVAHRSALPCSVHGYARVHTTTLTIQNCDFEVATCDHIRRTMRVEKHIKKPRTI